MASTTATTLDLACVRAPDAFLPRRYPNPSPFPCCQPPWPPVRIKAQKREERKGNKRRPESARSLLFRLFLFRQIPVNISPGGLDPGSCLIARRRDDQSSDHLVPRRTYGPSYGELQSWQLVKEFAVRCGMAPSRAVIISHSARVTTAVEIRLAQQ
jgi:hypothetical protein